MTTSGRFAAIKPFYVMDILERAQAMEAAGRRVIHLEIGEPDFDTPECVNEAARKAIADGKTHYTHSQGLPELRQAICGHYAERYGAAVDPEQVVVAAGTSPAMLLAFSVLLERGGAVLMPDPGYACYGAFVEYAGGEVRRVPAPEADCFQYRPAEVARRLAPDVRAVLVNSPSNPTGTVMDEGRMRELAQAARGPASGHGALIVSDEIYHGLVYEGREHSMLEFTDDCMVLGGFSKLYAMTGWRLGYLIAPRRFVPTLRKLAQNLFICAASVSQWAGLAALTCAGADVERMRATYAQRRRVLLDGLKRLGFSMGCEPTGAFYALVSARHLRLGRDSLALALDILDKAAVGVTPGIDFGPGGEGYLRFSYATSQECIEEGLARLGRYIERHG